MESNTIYEDQRGRMRLKVVCKEGRYGLCYSMIVYRAYTTSKDEQGKTVWEATHWLDEQDVLNSLRLHEVADDVIADARRADGKAA